MSRSGYVDDYSDEWAAICWRGAVASATKGKRGQTLLKDLLAALDAMPEKRLITDELENVDGEHCALGVLGKQRGMNLTEIDIEDYTAVANAFNIAEALMREIVFENDEGCGNWNETPEHRWERMRRWVANQIIKEE